MVGRIGTQCCHTHCVSVESLLLRLNATIYNKVADQSLYLHTFMAMKEACSAADVYYWWSNGHVRPCHVPQASK